MKVIAVENELENEQDNSSFPSHTCHNRSYQNQLDIHYQVWITIHLLAALVGEDGNKNPNWTISQVQ